jgi:hypothetical protein
VFLPTDTRETGGTPPATTHTAAITLLANYVASSFVDVVHAERGTSIVETAMLEQPQLTRPHR